jgi:AcrR family transcriptional regulator
VSLARSNGVRFTVQDVADEAGQSLRTLYQYFESKDDLLLAVFEEAMHTYARVIGNAIVDLSDPLERLGGALIAAVRMPESSDTGFDRGLTRLRLGLSEVEPNLSPSRSNPSPCSCSSWWPMRPSPAPSAPAIPRRRPTWSWP